jgi:hypothetical protein
MKHALLDHLTQMLKLKNDRQLSNYFEYRPPVFSKIRNRKMAISANVILLIHEKTDMPVAEIRRLIDESERQNEK